MSRRKVHLVQPKTSTSAEGHVIVVRKAPVTWKQAWDDALKIADGDAFRLMRCPDGSVIAFNKPRRRPQ
jgi:hypothetical protein